ncbi:MAG: (2Fe-2S)-binding protein [Phycisphaerae bacterium]|nr:(2Fe-2S)-binding protein [Phycisphaerae bacterium]
MEADENVCLCFQVSLRKLVHFMDREQPQVPSQLSECLGAGTGCQWCVPFLKDLHGQWKCGNAPELPEPSAAYADRRAAYKMAKREAKQAAAEAAAQAARAQGDSPDSAPSAPPMA